MNSDEDEIIVHENHEVSFKGFPEKSNNDEGQIGRIVDYINGELDKQPQNNPQKLQIVIHKQETIMGGDNQLNWQIAKKRKRSPSHTPTPTVTPTENRFAILQTTSSTEPNENSIPKEIKTPAPPPIFIYDVADYQAMIKSFVQIIEMNSFHARVLANDKIKISTHTVEAYRKLSSFLRREKIIHHTYQIREERAYRVVIRNLHHSVPIEEIKNELLTHGHRVRNIMNVRHRVTKEPLPMFFVDLEPEINNKRIYDLQYVCNTKITIEPPRKKRGIVQCMRCQEYGHSKAYCYRPHNCVKCGEQHDSKSCQKPKNIPAKCALCDGNHPANYKGCQVYKDLIQRSQHKTTNRPTNVNIPIPPINPITTDSRQQNEKPPLTYAQATSKGNQDDTSTQLTQQLSTFLQEFKNMFSQLLNQNSMILNLLTTVLKKLP